MVEFKKPFSKYCLKGTCLVPEPKGVFEHILIHSANLVPSGNRRISCCGF